MQILLVVIASIFAFVGNLPYLKSVYKGHIEPHAYTWLVWSLVSCITFFGQVAKGAGIGAIPTGVSEMFTIIIFFFSLKNGFKHVKRVDTVFLIICLLGLIPWYMTKDPTLSVIIAVSIDLIAFVPTLRKTWNFPRSENSILYIMNVSRHALSLFALDAYNIATTLHSIAMIVTNSLMTFFILRKRSTK